MGVLRGAVFPLCCLTWGQTMVAVMKIMLPSFKRSHAGTAALSSHDPAAGPSRPMPLPETPGHSQASLDQSLVGPLLLSPGFWYAQGFICALESVSPVLCKFWRLCGGVNGGLLSPRGLMSYPGLLHQSPWPCSTSLLICISTEDTQMQFQLSLCWVSGSWCTQVLIEPSEHLWQVWGLIINDISPLLPPYWGFSFSLGCGISFLVESNILL